jgi:single-stranded-DNA-specific exonuclease
VGTIADIMPLDGENRLLVKLGLSAINERSGHKGILFLTGKSKSTSKSISWDIAPLLNAPGRMGETGLTVDFFLEDDDVKLSETVNSIRDINDERKRIVAEIIEKIKNSGSADIINENLFFYMDNQIIDGLAGLIANRIADDFKKPVIIATGTGENGLVKGSGRSYGGFDFFKHTSGAAHLFERVGGHAQAFGFTAKENNVIEIIDIINNSLKEAYITENSVSIDLQLEIDDVNTAFINILHLLEPFGKCNEEPLFLIKDLSLDGFSSFGNQGTHGKYILAGNIQAIGWNMFEKMNQFYSQKKNIDLLFKLENNEYMGKTYPRIIIVDIDYSEK